MESGGEQNLFKREFDRLDAGNGVVLIRDMPRLIDGALGRETRPWIKDRILKMFEANRDGKISWLDLQDGLRKAVGATRSDVLYREQQIPEWLVFNRKVSTHHAYLSLSRNRRFLRGVACCITPVQHGARGHGQCASPRLELYFRTR